MKPRRMRPRVMWAAISEKGSVLAVCDTRAEARASTRGSGGVRVVRVRVSEAP